MRDFVLTKGVMIMIINAAILKDGIIYTGRRHHLIIQSHPSKFFIDCKQGFITEEGRFVDREEGLRIAIECNQLIREPKFELFSEDLWEL